MPERLEVEYRQIVEAMVTAVVVLDPELNIQYINSAAENLLHVSESHAKDLPLRELMMLGDGLAESLLHALRSNQPYTQRNAVLRLPDNVTEEVDFTVNLLESHRRTVQILLELQPLNRLKRINRDEESVARQETTRRLVRGLAHEVKNPLGGIRGAAQLLEQELRELRDQHRVDEHEHSELLEYTRVIISEADRLKELVDRLLGPRRQLNIKPCSVLRAVEHVIQLIEAERPGFVSWRRDYDPSLPDIEADETQLIQAVLNIVRNACEATADVERPTITLRSRGIRQFTIGHHRHRLVMQLDICDNGPGIEPSMVDRIFFPMISGRADGSGLGLAITQNIVMQHRGSIQVDSRPGHTCFSLYLPFRQPMQEEG